MPEVPTSEMYGIKISVTGARGEPSTKKDFIAKEIRKNAEHWSKFSSINMLNIDIKRQDKGGSVSYTVRAEATGAGSFHSDAEDWNLEAAMTEMLNRLDKALVKKKERPSSMLRRIFSKRKNSE